MGTLMPIIFVYVYVQNFIYTQHQTGQKQCDLAASYPKGWK